MKNLPLDLQILKLKHSIEINEWQLAHYKDRGKFKAESQQKFDEFIQAITKLIEQRKSELIELQSQLSKGANP